MAETKQLGAVLLVAGAALAFWSFGDRNSTDHHQLSEKITTVELAADSADIAITASDDDKSTVQVKRKYWLWKHGDAYSVDNGTLKLDGDCGWQCRADFAITVPRGTKVIGHNGSGDISIAGVSGVDAKSTSGEIDVSDVTGDVKLDLTSGDVKVNNLTGRLDVKATSGDIEAADLKGGPVNVESTSGDLELELAEANDVRAKGTSGDIHVTAPAGGYNVSADSRSGEVHKELGDDPNGTHTIQATTTGGDIDVLAR
jgi:putative adhesin